VCGGGCFFKLRLDQIHQMFQLLHACAQFSCPLVAAIINFRALFLQVSGKGSSDAIMIIEAMDCLYSNPSIAGFVLVSSDSDFTPLAQVQKRLYFLGGLPRKATIEMSGCECVCIQPSKCLYVYVYPKIEYTYAFKIFHSAACRGQKFLFKSKNPDVDAVCVCEGGYVFMSACMRACVHTCASACTCT